MIDWMPSRTVALTVLGWPVHWYGLMYLAGFLTAWYLLPRLQSQRSLSLLQDDWSRLLSWSIIGVIVGGRLGYVFLYEPAFYLHHPLRIPAVWEGGMASHGGFIGVLIALFIFCHRYKVSVWKLGDIVVVPVAIGLAFGRLGNFINQELYGSVTLLPWGITIPGISGLRHPTQIYAMVKDLFIALMCYYHLTYKKPVIPGTTGALFLMLYGSLRFALEFLRVPTHSLFIIGPIVLTRGQMFSIPLVIAGGTIIFWLQRKRLLNV